MTLTEAKNHEWARYFAYLRIEACCKKNKADDLAQEAKHRALHHLGIARALSSKGPIRINTDDPEALNFPYIVRNSVDTPTDSML